MDKPVLPLKAYEDVEFLKRDVSRSLRLQLEFLKPDTVMQDHKVRSTIVVFGSARVPDPEPAPQVVAAAEEKLAGDPNNPVLQQALLRAKALQGMSRYYQVARDFAALVSSTCQSFERCDFVIMTGGGGGIMEAGNRGAHDVGAKSVGLNISLPFEQYPNPYITPELVFQFHYFSIRKMHFLMRAKALCAFPGGYGTMDELFECLTLIQTRKIKPMPVVLFGREFWEKFLNWQYLADSGLIGPDDLSIFRYAETAQEGWGHICEFWRQHPSANGGNEKSLG